MTSKSGSNLQSLSLRHNFSWSIVGNCVYAACQWGMLVILAKLGTPEIVGQFTLGLALTAPVMVFSNLQLRAIQATDAHQEYQFDDYLQLRLLTTMLAMLVILALVWIGEYRGETAWVLLLVGLAKAIESISDILHGLQQQHERMDRIAQSMMMKGMLSLFALGIGVQFMDSLTWGLIGLVIAWAFVLLFYDIPGTQEFRSKSILLPLQSSTKTSLKWVKFLPIKWQREKLLKLALGAVPLGFVMLLISLQSNMPRYFIEKYFGSRDLGIFSAIAYLQVLGMTVVSALGQSASPRMAKYYFGGEHKEFYNLLTKLVGLFILLSGLCVLIVSITGQKILSTIYQPEYAQYHDLLIWIMVASGIWYVACLFGYAATAKRLISYQPVIVSVSLFASFWSCYWLVPHYGLWGASLSMLITSSLTMLGYGFLSFKS
jgi:O-antigen/teichoic acid export membrane protein